MIKLPFVKHCLFVNYGDNKKTTFLQFVLNIIKLATNFVLIYLALITCSLFVSLQLWSQLSVFHCLIVFPGTFLWWFSPRPDLNAIWSWHVDLGGIYFIWLTHYHHITFFWQNTRLSRLIIATIKYYFRYSLNKNRQTTWW